MIKLRWLVFTSNDPEDNSPERRTLQYFNGKMWLDVEEIGFWEAYNENEKRT